MDRLTLPLPARGIWLRVRSLLESARERLGPEAGPWKIGGGTVLAARWMHRESTDLDLTVNAGTAIPALFAGPDNDFEAEIRRRGGYSITFDRDRCTIGFSTGKLDLCALDPTPSPSLTAALLSCFGISSLRRQECSSGTTNARKPGNEVGQMVVLRTPPGCGSMPSAW